MVDLKTMSYTELEEEAQKIRQSIIESTSINGGHLASNLGVVELTMAIHRNFDIENDTIIFDVSHQCYTHKILTERKLDNLRKMNGVSGFSNPLESKYDSYSLGHSSTSIALAIGEAISCKKKGIQKNIVVVIGDASINNGLAIESLEYLATLEDIKVIVIINDNGMGISQNYSGITKTLNKLRIKRNKVTKSINAKYNFFDRLKRGIKSTFYNKSMFDYFNIKYFPMINGHDFKDLDKYLKFAENYPKSILLHVNTIKGKGYLPAENDLDGHWHHVCKFNIETGETLNNIKTVGEYLCDELINIHDIKSFKVITAGMTLGNGLLNFKEKYPEDLLDVGIAEEMAVELAAGISSQNVVPIVFIYSTFLARSYDQILNDIVRTNKHVVFCIDRAGIVAGDGDTHQGIFDLSFINNLPNVKIYAPASIEEAKDLLIKSIDDEGPIFIRYPKVLEFHESRFNTKWQVIKELEDINVITYGDDVYKLQNFLKNQHIGLINATSIKPLDIELLKELNNTKLIVYEQVNSLGGLFDSINHMVTLNNLHIDLKQIALVDTFLGVGEIEELKEKYLISYNRILEEIK